MSLISWGWNESWARSASVKPDLEPARIVAVFGDEYLVGAAGGEFRTVACGRLQHGAESTAELPSVGDWVLLRQGVIDCVLPRRTLVRRKAAGNRQEEQVLAANVEILFIVSGLDRDLNLRRLERYLVVALESGARPVFILNKADLCSSAGLAAQSVQAIAGGQEILFSSALDGGGVEQIRERLPIGTTGALIGSSGVGKSTLVNRLLGISTQAVNEVRDGDSRGRHTTAHRQLFRLPSGGLLIDQPGLREIQLWATETSLDDAFPEITALARECHFGDCRHSREPGCAVNQAVASGQIEESRLKSFHKLGREVEHLQREADTLAAGKRKQEIKRISRAMRRFYSG